MSHVEDFDRLVFAVEGALGDVEPQRDGLGGFR
jgi:hypothetical protein